MDVIRTAAFKLFQIYRRVIGPITLGVKAIVFDAEGRVLLVRHTYQPGWHFPGGGVKRGESVVLAAARELREETGIEASELPDRPFGVYENRELKHDHVVAFLFTQWRVIPNALPSPEIAEHAFFSLDALPKGTSKATLRRLDEYKKVAVLSQTW